MTVLHRVRAAAYRTAYRIPARWRRRLVRTVMPKYTIGSVILVRDADAPAPGRMLLLRQPPGHGWSLPGGLLDRGEVPVQTAVRELFEETGIKVSVEDLVELHPSAIVHTHGRWVDCVFETRVPAGVEFTVDGGEVLEAAWYRLDALPPLTLPTARLLGRYGIGPYADYPEAQI
jgi:ADP-ribose pyrophosphatase YjhB (NUDIX family)